MGALIAVQRRYLRQTLHSGNRGATPNHYVQDQKDNSDDEQHPGYLRRNSGNAICAQRAGDKPENEKNEGVIQHHSLPAMDRAFLMDSVQHDRCRGHDFKTADREADCVAQRTRWIVDIHGGTIAVKSDVGAGSEFRVTLQPCTP
jgi:hypothetical protein